MYVFICLSPYPITFVNNWENAFREYKQGLVSKEIE